MKKLLAIGVILTALLSSASSAFALQPTSPFSNDGSPVVQRITLTGIVPLMRVVYINQSENIVRVVGNTDQNITPEVSWNDSHGEAPMTPAIENQYKAILAAHNNHLEAGKTYYPPKPTIVQASASNFRPPLFQISLLNVTSI